MCATAGKICPSFLCRRDFLTQILIIRREGILETAAETERIATLLQEKNPGCCAYCKNGLTYTTLPHPQTDTAEHVLLRAGQAALTMRDRYFPKIRCLLAHANLQKTGLSLRAIRQATRNTRRVC